MNTNRLAFALVAAGLLSASVAPSAQATSSACTAAAQSASTASEAIIASAAPDDAAALMSCIFPLMPDREFRAAVLSAAAGVKNADLSQFIIETASNLLLRNSGRKVVPDGLSSPATPPTDTTGSNS